MLQSKGDFTSDRAITLMLQHAYSGTADERTRLLGSVKEVSPISRSDDAEAQLERWRRLVSYLPRFGIGTPDYGEMINAIEKLIRNFDSDDNFALDRALYVRENAVHNIGPQDAVKFEAYLDYIVSLVRVAGGKPPAKAHLGSTRSTKASGAEIKLCKFFAEGVGCIHGKNCRNKHETKEARACHACGQTGHYADKCTVVRQPVGGNGSGNAAEAAKGKAKGGGKGKPPAAAAATAEADTGKEVKGAAAAAKKEKAKAATAAKEEATMLATLTKILEGSSQPSAHKGRVVSAKAAVNNDGSSTLDSGASAIFRHPTPEDKHSKLVEVDVELALGGVGKAHQHPSGDIIHEGPQLTSMGVSVEDGSLTTVWGPSIGISMSQVSAETQEKIANLIAEGSSHIIPQVVDNVPMLSAEQTRQVQQQIGHAASVQSIDRISVDNPLDRPLDDSDHRAIEFKTLQHLLLSNVLWLPRQPSFTKIKLTQLLRELACPSCLPVNDASSGLPMCFWIVGSMAPRS